MNPKLTINCPAIALLSLCSLPGCQRAGYHSPAVDVLGAYFPAWMISIVIGLILTLIARLVLVALKLDPELRPAALVHLCLWVLFTLGTWIVLFKN
ncbi:MAG: hypothetical protein QOE70_3345 [Chthoniobacter sp.]|jgi:uncharacterized membrane protein|nr:hypothetical protein [Chthoniobacter sp.]